MESSSRSSSPPPPTHDITSSLYATSFGEKRKSPFQENEDLYARGACADPRQRQTTEESSPKRRPIDASANTDSYLHCTLQKEILKIVDNNICLLNKFRLSQNIQKINDIILNTKAAYSFVKQSLEKNNANIETLIHTASIATNKLIWSLETARRCDQFSYLHQCAIKNQPQQIEEIVKLSSIYHSHTTKIFDLIKTLTESSLEEASPLWKDDNSIINYLCEACQALDELINSIKPLTGKIEFPEEDPSEKYSWQLSESLYQLAFLQPIYAIPNSKSIPHGFYTQQLGLHGHLKPVSDGKWEQFSVIQEYPTIEYPADPPLLFEKEKQEKLTLILKCLTAVKADNCSADTFYSALKAINGMEKYLLDDKIFLKEINQWKNLLTNKQVDGRRKALMHHFLTELSKNERISFIQESNKKLTAAIEKMGSGPEI